ncbi:MAG: glycosyltransferase family 4 protein [Anaerolineae bacterium]
MHIAYFSPLPPAASGIADYSAELLPHLSQHAEITLFVDPNAPLDDALAESFPVCDLASFGRRLGEFDVALYHMGNDATYHAAIWNTLQKYPGIVVVHEPLFHHFFQQLTLSKGDVAGFVRIVGDTYGEVAAQRVRNRLDDGVVNPVAFPLLEPVLHGALGAIAHSHWAARQVTERCPGLPVAVIPHHLSLPAPFDGPVDREAIRRDLGLASRFVVGTFGFLTEWKRIPVALSAFARLYDDHSEAMYCLVGDVRLYKGLDVLIDKIGLPRGAVRITGRTSLDDFLSYMAATDVAINLRYPTAGETSGTLIRLLGLGIPTIVSDIGSFSEFPNDVCAQVSVDSFEEETLAAILRALAEDETLRQALAANAREYARTHHTLEGSAQAYATFIERVVAGEAEPVTPAAASPSAEIVSDIGRTLARWGITEQDDVLLEPIARAMAELGLPTDP